MALRQIFTDIADAIRGKNGSADTYTPAEMAQAIEDIPSGGGIPQALLDLLEGTASGEVTINGIETLGVGLFFNSTTNAGVTVLNMPDLLTTAWSKTEGNDGPGISGSDINSPTVMRLETINLPKCTFMRFPHINGNVSNSMLQTLKNLNAPMLQTIAGGLWGTGLEHVNFPELTATYNTSFQNCVDLETFSAPKLCSLAGSMFQNCAALTTLETGQLTSIGSSTFRGCSSLEGPLDLTCATMFGWWTYVCAGCTVLEQVEFQNSGSLGQFFFQNSGIKAIVIRHKNASGLLSLGAINALAGTPIESGTGYIYVPRDQVATYQAASNWSTYAAQFRALEDYTDDGTVDGEFIMPAA